MKLTFRSTTPLQYFRFDGLGIFFIGGCIGFFIFYLLIVWFFTHGFNVSLIRETDFVARLQASESYHAGLPTSTFHVEEPRSTALDPWRFVIRIESVFAELTHAA